MIRVSDQVETRLKEVADGRSMNATIEKMLAYCSSPDGFCPTPQADTSYEPYLLEQMNKRFDELKSLIEDTTVDRVAGPKVVAPGTSKVYVPWDVARELFYEFLDEKSTEWRPNVYNILQDTDDALNCYIQDGYICVDDHYGKQHLLVQVSPRVEEFLKKVEPSI